jgi:hypothetical protein
MPGTLINRIGKNLSLNMHRCAAPLMILLICLFCAKCTKWIDPPSLKTEAQRLMMTGTWTLAYTDSIAFDSTNNVHYYRIPASECEKQEPIAFHSILHYYMQLVCNQPAGGELIGAWTYNSDSTFGYGSKSDTMLNSGRLITVTQDTLKLVQQSSFATPDSLYPSYVEKTYSR